MKIKLAIVAFFMLLVADMIILFCYLDYKAPQSVPTMPMLTEASILRHPYRVSQSSACRKQPVGKETIGALKYAITLGYQIQRHTYLRQVYKTDNIEEGNLLEARNKGC